MMIAMTARVFSSSRPPVRSYRPNLPGSALSAALCSRDIHLTDRSNCLISNVLGDAMKNLLLTAALVVWVNSLTISAVSAAESSRVQ